MQTSIPHLSPPLAGPSFHVVGDLYTIRATGDQTGGALCLIEARVGAGAGPPPHVHAREDESFYVLEGEITFYTATGPHRAGPGSFVHLPKGVPHTFRNETEREARMLIWCTPAGFDRFVEAVGVPAPGADAPPRPPTPEEIERVLARCPDFGITILPALPDA